MRLRRDGRKVFGGSTPRGARLAVAEYGSAMSRELQVLPARGEPHLSPDEILKRLRAEFRFVETDHELGKAMLLRSIARREGVNPRVLELGPGSKGTGEARRAAIVENLRSALPHACHLNFGDDSEHAHGHPLVPSDGILVVVEEDWQATLAERCARVLGYVVHEI